MQLDRILQKHGFGTRKECRALCWDGRVAVNGLPHGDPFTDIDCAGLVLTVDGIDWPYAEFVTLMLHKPLGYECSRKPQHHPSVLYLLPPLSGSVAYSLSGGSTRIRAACCWSLTTAN